MFYGNHQNAPRVKKSDLEPENHEIASAVDDHIAAILEDKVKQDDAANENASQVTLSKGSEENAISSQSKSEEDEENSYESQLEQFSDKNGKPLNIYISNTLNRILIRMRVKYVAT